MADQESPGSKQAVAAGSQQGKKKGGGQAGGSVSGGVKRGQGKKVAGSSSQNPGSSSSGGAGDSGSGGRGEKQVQVLRIIDTNAAPALHEPSQLKTPVPAGDEKENVNKISPPRRTTSVRSKTEAPSTKPATEDAKEESRVEEQTRSTTSATADTKMETSDQEQTPSAKPATEQAKLDKQEENTTSKITLPQTASAPETLVNEETPGNSPYDLDEQKTVTGDPTDTQDDIAGLPAHSKLAVHSWIQGNVGDAEESEDTPPGRFPGWEEYPPLSIDENDRESREREQRYYRAYGVRFAPWNIPFKRRLQTLAVLVHSLSIASTVSFFFFLCAIPLTWPLLIPYLLHMLLSKAATDGRLRFRSERFRRMPMWKFFADYFPARLHKTHELPPTRKYIFGYHPHGIISHGAFAAFATEALGFSEKFPGITNCLLTLESNFRIPLYREYILSLGIQSVSKDSITNILTRGGRNGEGMGRAVTIVIGGARESLEAQPGTMHLVLGERKGFIKLAVRTGADLVPVLAFGENDLYDQVSPKTHPALHRAQMWVLRTLKFTLPFLHGRGIFNYDVGLMPYRRPLNIVVGKPIKVAQARGEAVDSGEVDRLHGEYVAELRKMWERYKDDFAAGRKEEMVLLK